MTKACTTHHHACACRESHFRRLQQDNSWAEEKLSGMAIELAELREALDTLTLVIGLTPIAGNREALQEAVDLARAALLKQESEG